MFLWTTLGFIRFLALQQNLRREVALFFFFQELLNFLFLIRPNPSTTNIVLALKGGFGPLFEWLPQITGVVKGASLLHLLTRIKLPYFPIFLQINERTSLIFFLGRLLASFLLFHTGSSKRLLLLRRLEGGNLLLLVENQRVNYLVLFLLYLLNFYLVGGGEGLSPEERLEKSFYFLSLPLNISFSLKLIIIRLVAQKGLLLRVLIRFL